MWPFRRAKRSRVDPHQHHPFDEPSAMGMAVAGTGGGKGGSMFSRTIGWTMAVQLPTRCAVAGCGKDRHDPIHIPVDD
jgi:hypothetical protein